MDRNMEEPIKKLIIRMDPELHKRLKVYCAEKGQSVQELLNELITEFLKFEEQAEVFK